MSKTKIHPTAIVERGAELGTGVVIGPYCTVGPKVAIHDHVEIVSHAVIRGRTSIGEHTKVWPFASLGTEPQDLKYRGEDARLVIGRRNMIREYSNISIGTSGGGGQTVIGDENLLMVNVHVAHDCIVGNGCVFANRVSLAGHVEVGNKVVVGGHVGTHQFVRIGSYAMCAGGAIIVQDAPPFCIVQGDRASPKGLNMVGLKRGGFNSEEIMQIEEMYQIIYQRHNTVDKAVDAMAQNVVTSGHRSMMMDFLKNSKRGLCR